MSKKWVVILTLLIAWKVQAETFTNRATVVTQDGELIDGAIVYVLSIERQGAEYMVHRFCVLEVDRWHEYRLSYDTGSGADVIHVPYQVLDIAEAETNKVLENKYHFYKPQLWLLGVW